MICRRVACVKRLDMLCSIKHYSVKALCFSKHITLIVLEEVQVKHNSWIRKSKAQIKQYVLVRLLEICWQILNGILGFFSTLIELLIFFLLDFKICFLKGTKILSNFKQYNGIYYIYESKKHILQLFQIFKQTN